MRRLLMAGMALALLATALPSSVVTASNDAPDIAPSGPPAGAPYLKTTGHFGDTHGFKVHVCHRTRNEGHWVAKTVAPTAVDGRGKNDHSQHDDYWQGVYVTDFYPSPWQVANQTCGPRPNTPPKTPPKSTPILRYGGRILGPCGDPFYTARIWNGSKSTRPVAIILEVRGGKTLWKRVLQPGQSIKPRAVWVRGGVTLILRRGNGDVIDRERTVTGTFPWTECRSG